MIFFTLVHQI